MESFVPLMEPGPGERLVRYVGDRVRFSLRDAHGRILPPGWSARLRTNIGRGKTLLKEYVEAHARHLPPAGASWRDIPMTRQGNEWIVTLPLTEVGFFKAKPYALDTRGWQHWPEGPDVGVSVHPDYTRTGNTIYCAFVRLFGRAKHLMFAKAEPLEAQLRQLDQQGYTVIPPSGKLRELTAHLDHIFGVLGCRILHLLPVNPTPTTYARLGRIGSPYASLDLTGIDPALVEFDRRTTGVDQFRELAYEVHARGGRLFLDIAINHTGWGSVMQENHPEWFMRTHDGQFLSPGAWGVVWEDLVELKHDNVALWDELAEVFLTWCRRGVDGFRCDAGYKVPVPAWQYIVARVRQEFPETVFLLEGLGGSWEATELLLTEGGMQWAYSELFQNYSGRDVATYLDYALRQSQRLGLYVHYSETHDNNRLAAQGRTWSLLRNRLCALASVTGGFGFTCGVEWLAREKIDVHAITGLAWGNPDNLVAELARLNWLLANHPCFFDGAKLTRLSPVDSAVLALRRDSAEGKDSVLVLVNTDTSNPQTIAIAPKALAGMGELKFDLLGQTLPEINRIDDGTLRFVLPPAASYCLAAAPAPKGLSGGAYRRMRAQAAWAIRALARTMPIEQMPDLDWQWLAAQVDQSPRVFLAAAAAASRVGDPNALIQLIEEYTHGTAYPQVVTWRPSDCRRITVVPAQHWLLIHDDVPFRAVLKLDVVGELPVHVESVPTASGHVACFGPYALSAVGSLELERYGAEPKRVVAELRFVDPSPLFPARFYAPPDDALALLTNGIGGMAQIRVDLGSIRSKYDCVLAANLHPRVPVDRHVFVKRIRVWVNADGFISPLDGRNLAAFEPGPPAVWEFVANAGDARTVQVCMVADMLEGANTTVFKFSRPSPERAVGKQLPPEADVRLTVRLDIEDRNFHWETQRNAGSEYHFTTHTQPLPDRPGFIFAPAPDRQLRAFSSAGEYHPQPEWCQNIPHPVEATRGLIASGDAYSPGWFELPLPPGATVTVVVTAESEDPSHASLEIEKRRPATQDAAYSIEAQLTRAIRAFVVRRNGGKTIIAGYPWFLDWGRDALICARGLIAAGLIDEAKQLLLTFARLEENGTLPNALAGEMATNRDTSDAPLWFAIACEAAADVLGDAFYHTRIGKAELTVADVLADIAANYINGTPNGIRVDPDSCLVWSPAHFTWMDTSFPACTPREGYPIEIQALWIRLLRLIARLDLPQRGYDWNRLAARACDSLNTLYWLERKGYFADVLLAKPGEPAVKAVQDDALRSNFLLAISLGVLTDARARRALDAAIQYLVVPGAVRSLAPLPVAVPLPIYGRDGQLLNNPTEPYWGRYEGDEDTRRKPAYHNGTAWTWSLPVFCEALARAWNFAPEAVHAARCYLASVAELMTKGCLGHIPEILDGDAPHTPRGCDAQAWSVTETLRVWKLLNNAAI
ncbi:MAG: amylo-alpha-1,6-glucosidase [Verrucomicrobiales bacterium]|nr:amylo-alpha-1,6-glucosidase [Verrucomicrobiales bacterium]